jgi:hypothetical protein
MKTMAVAGFAAIVLAQGTSAQAALNRIYAYGAWQVFDGTNENQQPVCVLQSSGADGRQLSVEQDEGSPDLMISLTKPSWNIPDNTQILVVFQYDRSAQPPMQGVGAANRVTITLPYDQAAQFDQQFRASRWMRIAFPSGNEPPWTGNLAGSNAVLTAFDNCRARLSAQPAQASTGPTQPFTAAPAAPTQPFTAAPVIPVHPAPDEEAPAAPAPAPAAPTQPAAPQQQ